MSEPKPSEGNLDRNIELDGEYLEQESDEENFDEELLIRNFEAEAKLLKDGLLPEKSKDKYIQAYDKFMKWKEDNQATKINQDTLLVYFDELKKTLKPPTLWSIWSKLKATLSLRNNIDIGAFAELKTYLKIENKGYKPKKSKTLTLSNIDRFLESTKKEEQLAYKAIAIIGYFGCLRSQEILNLKWEDLEDVGNHYVITVNETKTNTSRNFVVSGKYYNLVKDYASKRPKGSLKDDRFFVTDQNGRCIKQFVGKNKICEVPKIIATKVDLPNPELYTSHCFRRSSASALSHATGDLVLVKYHGGWKSDRVAQGYIDFSTAKRQQIFDLLSGTEEKRPTHFMNHPPVNILSASTSKNIAITNANQNQTIVSKAREPRDLTFEQSPSNLHKTTAARRDNEFPCDETPQDRGEPKQSVRVNNQMAQPPILEVQSNAHNSFENSTFDNLTDEYDEQLLNIDLENVENGMPKNQINEKRYSNVHVNNLNHKKFKPSTSSEDKLKSLFQNCEIVTVNVNRNYYYSCKHE